MDEFFVFFLNQLNDIVTVFNGFTFVISGITVGLIDIMVGLLCISMIATVFWKGSKG